MPVKPVDKIWMNGKFVNWNDANIHILSHVVHYGSSWFEGIRCYDTKRRRDPPSFGSRNTLSGSTTRRKYITPKFRISAIS